MKEKIVVAICVLSIFLGGQLLSSDASAELIKNSLTVSPQHQTVTLVPGEVFEGLIKVSAQAGSDVATGFEISVGPFSQVKNDDSKDDYGDVNYVESSTYNQIVDWITFDSTSGVVKPNETKVIPFKITVPEDAPAGGQYASIIVRDANPSVSEDDGLAINSVFQIISILYADVAGETRQTGEITDNSMPSFLLNGPLDASSMVKNTGNVHTRAQYTFQVWPLFSAEEICTNEEDPETSLVLPETERYHSQTCQLPSIGIFKAKQTVKLFDKTSVTEKMVIICPLWLLFVIVAFIIILIFWVAFNIRGKKRTSSSEKPSNE